MIALAMPDNRILDSILQGDCLEVMPSLPTGSVDTIIIDPPYFLPAEHYQTRVKWARSLSDLSIIEHFIGSVFAECRRILKPEGALLAFCDGQSYPVMYARSYRLFDRITDIIWDKGCIGMGRGVRRQHEIILAAIPASFQWHGWIPSVIKCAPIRSQDRMHPAEKPVELLRQLCKLTTPSAGIILDCFAGSASTCVGARLEGMHYIGIEREAEYASIARSRVSNVVSADLWEVQ